MAHEKSITKQPKIETKQKLHGVRYKASYSTKFQRSDARIQLEAQSNAWGVIPFI